jgi:hypothetical protein
MTQYISVSIHTILPFRILKNQPLSELTAPDQRLQFLKQLMETLMRILALADIHGNGKDIPTLADVAAACDVIVMAGDITDFGGTEQAESVLSALNQFKIPVLGVAGNCDSSGVNEILAQQGGDLTQKYVKIDKVLFVGLPYRVSQELVTKIIETVSQSDAEKVVLVSHEPAWGTAVDVQASTYHKGSQAVRSFIELNQPVCAVSGHIHEASGTDQLGDTLLVNPGPFRNGRYAIIDITEESAHAKLHWL